MLAQQLEESPAVEIIPHPHHRSEWLLKPIVDRTHWGGLAFPSGHVTSVAALATVVTVLVGGAPARVPRVLRLGLASIAFLIAAAVAAAPTATPAATPTAAPAAAAPAGDAPP